jgi:hypothetical protein
MSLFPWGGYALLIQPFIKQSQYLSLEVLQSFFNLQLEPDASKDGVSSELWHKDANNQDEEKSQNTEFITLPKIEQKGNDQGEGEKGGDLYGSMHLEGFLIQPVSCETFFHDNLLSFMALIPWAIKGNRLEFT